MANPSRLCLNIGGKEQRKLFGYKKLDCTNCNKLSVTASCTLTAPWHACIIGLIGGAIPVFGVRLIAKVKVDDPIGAVSVHMMCGLWVCTTFYNAI